jgi:hypothetical protein
LFNISNLFPWIIVGILLTGRISFIIRSCFFDIKVLMFRTLDVLFETGLFGWNFFLLARRFRQGRQVKQFPDPRVRDISSMRNECLGDYLVVHVQLDDTILGQVEQEPGDVGREHLAGMVRNLGRQAGGTQDHNSLADHSLVGLA